MKKRFVLTYLGSLFCWIFFLGCATAPAPILPRSGDSDLAGLLESIRVKERLPALAAAIIIESLKMSDTVNIYPLRKAPEKL